MPATMNTTLLKAGKNSRSAGDSFVHFCVGLLITAGMLFVLCSCSKGQNGSADSGSISFSLKMAEDSAGRAHTTPNAYKALPSAFDCAAYGIATIRADVYDESSTLLCSGGPWNCTDRQGIISNIPAGINRTIVIRLFDASGNEIFLGQRTGIEVLEGQTAEAGSIVVNSVTNHTPVFTAIAAQQVLVNQAITFAVSATDQDGDTIVYGATGLPTGASFDVATRTFTWTPTSSIESAVTVTFTATDDRTPPLSASMPVSITVTNSTPPPAPSGNLAPVMAPIVLNEVYPAGAALTIDVNASDPNTGDTLTFEIANMPDDALNEPVYSFNSTTGVLSWTPSWAGDYRVLFIVHDNGNPRLSDFEEVAIHVENGVAAFPHYPVLAPITIETSGTVLSVDLNASDEDGDTLSYYTDTVSGKISPSDADFSFNAATGEFSWDTASVSPGNYYLEFGVNDGNFRLDSGEATFTVGNVNRPPVLTPIGRRHNISPGPTGEGEVSFVITAVDPDGDDLEFSFEGPVGEYDYDPSRIVFNDATQTLTLDVSGMSTSAEFGIRIKVTDNGSPAENDFEDVVISIYANW